MVIIRSKRPGDQEIMTAAPDFLGILPRPPVRFL